MKVINYTFTGCISGVLTLLLSCQTPQKLYQKGNYDQAIQRALEHLRQQKVQEKDVITLTEAFNYVQTRDRAQLRSLQADKNWAETLKLATQIEQRENLVKPLLGLNQQKYYGKLASLQIQHDMPQIIAATRAEAATFYYDKAIHSLEVAKTTQRLAARTAYEAFQETESYITNYKDVNVLKNEAYNLGLNHIYFHVFNESNKPLPMGFETTVKEAFKQDFDAQWVQYHTSYDKNFNYNYEIIAKITNILITPERESQKQLIHEKEIPDGFEPTSSPGDSIGSTMRVQRYKTVKSVLHELQQTKSVHLWGTLDYIDNRTQELVVSRPLKVDALFENVARRCDGDPSGLPNHVRLGGSKMPFPSDEMLLLTAAQNMKKVAKQIIKDHNHIVFK